MPSTRALLDDKGWNEIETETENKIFLTRALFADRSERQRAKYNMFLIWYSDGGLAAAHAKAKQVL